LQDFQAFYCCLHGIFIWTGIISEKRVLLYSNNIAQGELSFQDISFNPFRQFPDISIYGIQMEFDNRVEHDQEALFVERLKASFNFSSEVIQSRIDTDMELDFVQLSDKIQFRNKSLRLETAFTFQVRERILQIEPSLFSIDQAMMNISGDIDINVNDKFHFEVDGSDHDFSMFRLFLSREGLKNLKQGDLYFRGFIKGTPGDEIPVADFTFGLEDVTMYLPLAEDYIRELNLSGKFNSGSRGDLSAASLDIDTLLAQLPSGHLNASLQMVDFASPKIDLIWDMEASLYGLESVFKMEFLDSLRGEIDTECRLLGAHFDPDSNYIIADFFMLDIHCDDVSLSIPGIISIHQLAGDIRTDMDTTWLMNLDVSVSTSTSKVLDFETNPEMVFEINNLDGTVEDFLPRLTDISGELILGEKYHRTFLDFNSFEIAMLESRLNADLELHSPAKRRTYIAMDVQAGDLNPGELLWEGDADSIPYRLGD